jgi:hypothetical protein
LARFGEIGIGMAAAAMVSMTAAAPGLTQNRQPGELRCGWYANPTPGNHWLTDRDRTWTLMTQGSRGAPGMDNLPDMTTIDWQQVNGPYGYGCACVRMTVDRRTGQVTRIYSGRPIPIRRCEQDRALRRP